ncbi:MAG: glycosyltransferase family 1 protein [Anaerolineae bacterium]
MSIIGIDYTPAIEQEAGIGRYVRELVAALAQLDTQTDYRLFTAHTSQNPSIHNIGTNFRWQTSPFSSRWHSRIWHRLNVPLSVEWIVGSVDLFHSTDFVLPPTRRSTISVLTVHDLSFVRVPETASPRLKAYLDSVVPRSVKRADHILADSTATKKDLLELYGVRPEKITVLLSGVDSHFVRSSEAVIATTRRKYGISELPYIFSVGTVQPRKNYSRLIGALSILRAHNYDIQLIIAGGRGWLESEIYETLKRHRLGDYVNFIGFANDTDLPALYSGAACFAFPSLYEGFGFPVLEAMACGTPTVTSNVSSLPEVAGDAAIVIDPYDIEELANAIRSILDDKILSSRLSHAGLDRARQFTWEKSALHLRNIYDHLLGK